MQIRSSQGHLGHISDQLVNKARQAIQQSSSGSINSDAYQQLLEEVAEDGVTHAELAFLANLDNEDIRSQLLNDESNQVLVVDENDDLLNVEGNLADVDLNANTTALIKMARELREAPFAANGVEFTQQTQSQLNRLDRDNDGEVSRKELSEIDHDGDGLIAYDEAAQAGIHEDEVDYLNKKILNQESIKTDPQTRYIALHNHVNERLSDVRHELGVLKQEYVEYLQEKYGLHLDYRAIDQFFDEREASILNQLELLNDGFIGEESEATSVLVYSEQELIVKADMLSRYESAIESSLDSMNRTMRNFRSLVNNHQLPMALPVIRLQRSAEEQHVEDAHYFFESLSMLKQELMDRGDSQNLETVARIQTNIQRFSQDGTVSVLNELNSVASMLSSGLKVKRDAGALTEFYAQMSNILQEVQSNPSVSNHIKSKITGVLTKYQDGAKTGINAIDYLKDVVNIIHLIDGDNIQQLSASIDLMNSVLRIAEATNFAKAAQIASKISATSVTLSAVTSYVNEGIQEFLKHEPDLSKSQDLKHLEILMFQHVRPRAARSMAFLREVYRPEPEEPEPEPEAPSVLQSLGWQPLMESMTQAAEMFQQFNFFQPFFPQFPDESSNQEETE